MNYHFVWCPKYRKKVLVGETKKRLEELIVKKCAELNGEIKSLAVGDDHVHLFVRTSPIISPNSFIGQVKGFTSRILRQEFSELRTRIPTLWTRSYFVSTHGHISDKRIMQYIDEQKGM
jgi:putative transposase